MRGKPDGDGSCTLEIARGAVGGAPHLSTTRLLDLLHSFMLHPSLWALGSWAEESFGRRDGRFFRLPEIYTTITASWVT